MASSTQLKVVFHKAVALRRMQSELYGTQDPYARKVVRLCDLLVLLLWAWRVGDRGLELPAGK